MYPSRLRVVAATLSLALASSTMTLAAAPAQAAPGNPGVPGAPNVILNEGFQDGPATPQMVTSYKGYTGSSYWTRADRCNGIILNGTNTASYTDPVTSGTCAAQPMTRLTELARAIGTFRGDANPNTNRVVAAYTQGGNGTANEVQLESPTQAVIPGRWYTASVTFAAQNCSAGAPRFAFGLVDVASGTESSVGAAVNACTAEGVTSIGSAQVGRIESPRSVKWAGGTQMKLRVRNANGSGTGNDAAIDDLRLIDATPQLDKQFIPAGPVRTNEPFTLRLTVTNTSELALKDGIDLTDTLDPGLAVAPGAVTNTCGGTVAAAQGTRTVSLNGGALADNQVSCQIEVKVVATRTGTFSNGPANVESPLLAPATTSITVAAPDATDDTATAAFNNPVNIPVLNNDGATPWVPGSVVFPADGQPDGATVSADGKTLTVPGEGTYVIGANDAVRFTPEPGYFGTATPVTYQVTDEVGNVGDATITVTVEPPPSAGDDDATTPFDYAVNVKVLDNDTPSGDQEWVDNSIVFPADGQPDGATVSADGKTLTVPGEGVYTARDDGTVTFTPDDDFTGEATPVTYEVTDTAGNSVDAQILITVGTPPAAEDDTATTAFDRPVDIVVLGNDTASGGAELDPSSVVFPADGQPDGATISADRKTLTVPGEGVYTVSDQGVVTFTPEDDFTGEATPVTYEVTDTVGNAVNAEIAITVGAPPSALDDEATTPFNNPVDLPVLGNDSPSEGGAWDRTSVVFPTAGQPAGATVSDDGKLLTVPGEGVYTVSDEGVVTFTPEGGFTGGTTPVVYEVTDTIGNTVEAQIRIEVGTPPAAEDDDATTPYNNPVDIDILDNDDPSGTAEWDRASVVFPTAGQPESATVSDDGKSLTVPGEGKYTISDDGTVTFTPEDGFTGEASPVTYEVTDTVGNTVDAQITVTVGAPPTATDDEATTAFNNPVDVDVLTNDEPSEGEEWDPTTVEFPTEGQPDGATVSDDGKTLTIPGEGVYTIDDQGVVTFTPEDDFTGEATPVTYEVTDTAGNTADAQITITVGAPPKATDDTASTSFNTPVDVTVLTNDDPSEGEEWDPATVVFPTDGQPADATVSADGKALTVPGEGVYTVNPDGTVTFTPDEDFTGEASPVAYQVTDTAGNTADAQITITVGAPGTALDDEKTTPFNTPVEINVLDNDTPSAGAEWIATSVVFPTDGQPDGATVSDDGKTLTVPGEGVYTIAANGIITFTPEDGFTGETTPVTYQITDTAGNIVTAQITVTVADGPVDPVDPTDPADSTATPSPSSSGPASVLPSTGGPQLTVLLVAVIALGAGAVILRSRRGRP